jgi:hypothetical protein
VNIDDISIVIPYLGSKFNLDHFRRMQINLNIDYYAAKIRDAKLIYFFGILPKHITIQENLFFNNDAVKNILETFEPSIVSYNCINVNFDPSSNLELL